MITPPPLQHRSMALEVPTDAESHLQLLSTSPVHPTPAGAFRAVARRTPDAVGSMLRAILREGTTPTLDLDALLGWTGADDEQTALRTLLAAQDAGLIEGIDAPRQLSNEPLELLVPPLLHTLSDEGKVLVADPDGLAVWSVGFDAEFATRLAAMSADLASLQERHADTLLAALGDEASAWALVDGIGASRIGCWPIHVADTRFVLVVKGLPRMHHPNFTLLVWLLVHRYG